MIIRSANASDVEGIVELDRRVWASYPTTQECIRSRIEIFSEGNFVALIGDRIVGYACCMLFNKTEESLTWDQLTENGTTNNHDPNGRDFFGVALTIDPTVQQKGIGTTLLIELGTVVVGRGIRYAYLGSRIPHFHKHQLEFADPLAYANSIDKNGKSIDPEIRFYRRAGFEVVSVVKDYINDSESLNYGVIIRTTNPFLLLHLPQFTFLLPVYKKIWRWLGLRLYS